MTKHADDLPCPDDELEHLAEYYGTHNTGDETEDGEWVKPEP